MKSNEYMFGVSYGKLPAKEVKRKERIARKHGCEFIYEKFPGDGYKSWYAGPNRGNPFDQNMAKEVLGEVDEVHN